MLLTCRSCQQPLRTLFADLGMAPFSNAFRTAEELSEPELFYPLRAYVCDRCKLVQLPNVAAPESHFNDHYLYLSSFTPSWVEHARRYVDMAERRFGLDARSFVVEIASNDGYLLQFLKAKKIPCLGVDPAANCAAAAREKFGVDTLVTFFDPDTAKLLLEKYGPADLVVANNVLAHVPELNHFVASVARVLKADGVASFEFPHLLRLMAENQFDTIYHEHYSYLSYHAVAPLLSRHGLFAFDAERLSTHGGSLRLFVGRFGARWPISQVVQALADEERDAGLGCLDVYLSFAKQVAGTKRKLQSLLNRLKEQGSTIAGYGAPAKGNTLLNYCGIRTDIIDFTVDRNTFKQGRYLPGSLIPILPVEAIEQRRPDYLLVLPWNLQTEIFEQMGFIKEWGGKFILPIPVPEIVS
ncbi:MAG: class I SAM-dependent methyltransferase [Xanthobacteraceae bacterium]|jgi:SAM-dependent methyltransferase